MNDIEIISYVKENLPNTCWSLLSEDLNINLLVLHKDFEYGKILKTSEESVEIFFFKNEESKKISKKYENIIAFTFEVCKLLISSFNNFFEKNQLLQNEVLEKEQENIKYKEVMSKSKFSLDFIDSYFYWLNEINNNPEINNEVNLLKYSDIIIDNCNWKHYSSLYSNLNYYSYFYKEYQSINTLFFDYIFSNIVNRKKIIQTLKIIIVGGGSGIEFESINKVAIKYDVDVECLVVDRCIWPLNCFNNIYEKIKKVDIKLIDVLSFLNLEHNYDIVVFSRVINYTELCFDNKKDGNEFLHRSFLNEKVKYYFIETLPLESEKNYSKNFLKDLVEMKNLKVLIKQKGKRNHYLLTTK